MTAAEALVTLPGTPIRSLGLPEDVDFFDRQSAVLDRPLSPVEAWTLLMARPMPVLALAFRIRDVISAQFGVAAIGGFSGAAPGRVVAGDKLDFFDVAEATPDALVLVARDVHLVVVTCISTQGSELTITSSVRTFNWFGRAYMLPVAPAHRLIVWGMLRQLRKMSRDDLCKMPPVKP